MIVIMMMIIIIIIFATVLIFVIGIFATTIAIRVVSTQRIITAVSNPSS